ncbi:unnamed protein product [Owenia fusiformis]|uniref:Uncharacterized protein n=1 Tax=Owenia fusiformis TaxID=6347 RepID=A0A8J1YDE8_OWEFU|nr:unnamed protein product [Owenia fusiformis]
MAGMLKPNDGGKRSLCVMRNIPYLQQGQFQKDDIKFACHFIDMDRTVEPPVINTEVKNLIGKLQDDTLKKCGNILKYDGIKWVQDGGVTEHTHQEYIKAMGKQVGKSLQGAIKRAIETTPDMDSVTQECASHLKFCYSRANSFFGRVDLIDEGLKYFKVNGEVTRVPLVVHGTSGAGKTSLMAALAYRGIKQVQDSTNPVLVVRFCGTTPLSSSGRVLLKSICDQIKEAFDDGQPSPPISYAYADLIVEFKRQIGRATTERPIVILIDSLDQLNDDDFARTEPVWIPNQLPPHVYLAISTLPNIGGSYKYLKTTDIPEVEVVPINIDDAKNILSAWLEISERTLTKSQLNTVLSVATDGTKEQPTALRLRLLCDAVVRVESYSELPELPNTVTGLINAFFERLEVYHGKVLVQTCFGLLSTARFGLSESELIDLLSCDDNVMDAVLQYHKPPEKRLPYVVFARLMNDIKDYVSIRGGLGKNAMTWYHRQFKEASERKYRNKNLINLSNHLSKYFDNTFSKEFRDRGIAPQPLYWKSNDGESEGRINLSAVAELPTALMAGQRRKRCVEVLADPVFLSAKCYAGFGRDLVGDLFDLKDTLSNFVMMIPNDEDRAMDSKDDTINDLAEFIRSEINILERNTELFVQQGMDQIKSTIAKSLIEEYQTKDGGLLPWVPNSNKRPLVEHINKYQGAHPCVMTLDGHTAPVTVVSLQMIKGQAIISASEDGSVRLWDRTTGRQIGKMTTKNSDLIFSPDHDKCFSQIGI